MTTPQTIPCINLLKEHAPYAAQIEEVALRVIRSGRYLHGPATEDVEERMQRITQTDHAVACSNGLDAIRLILRSYIELGRLKPGDAIVVPANTFIASILPVTEFNLRPVLVEPCPLNHGLDFNIADEAAIREDAKAVIITHLYGIPCWNDEICRRWADRGLIIIEDNAQSLGSQAATAGLYETKSTGGLGHAAATSFYPTKNAGALGDAGCVTTNDSLLAQTVRALANYGSDRRYHNIYCGYNCRIDEIQAAMLSVILDHLNEINETRRRTANFYLSHISNPCIKLPSYPQGSMPVWHQFVLRCDTPDQRSGLISHLNLREIASDIHYPVPPHLQPCYAGRLVHDPLPITELLSRTIISIPVQALDAGQLQRITDAVNSFTPGSPSSITV